MARFLSYRKSIAYATVDTVPYPCDLVGVMPKHRRTSSGCVPKSIATKRGGKRLKKGFKYSKGGCIRRAKGK